MQDLCEQCEAKEGIHPANHIFLKIKKPQTIAATSSPSSTPKPSPPVKALPPEPSKLNSNNNSPQTPPQQLHPHPLPPSSQQQQQQQVTLARFVSETMKEAQLPVGSIFTKTWRVKNDGSSPWPTVCTSFIYVPVTLIIIVHVVIETNWYVHVR